MKNIGRKIYHISGGLALISLYAYLGRQSGLAALLGVFLFATALDIARLKIPAFNEFFYRHLTLFIRQSERDTLTGTPWYLLGILCAAAFYDVPVGVYAVAFLAVGDVSATTVGERWGTIKISGVKSLQGTIAFVVAATVAGFIVKANFYDISSVAIVVGAITAAGAELLPVRINDNLTIPVISGAVMELVLATVG